MQVSVAQVLILNLHGPGTDDEYKFTAFSKMTIFPADSYLEVLIETPPLVLVTSHLIMVVGAVLS